VKIHPSDLLLEDILLCMSSDRAAILVHLSVCPACRSRLTALHKHPGAGVPAEAWTAARTDYGALIERSERDYLVRSDVVERERTAAPALVDELAVHLPEKRRQLLLANSSRFHTWGVYEQLLDRSWAVRDTQPRLSEELACLALELSNHLDSSYYMRELIEDLRCRAWSYIANLRRRASDLAGSEAAFQTAYAHLRRGTREPFERALFLDLKASLRRAQRRFDEATRLLGRAVAIFKAQGDEARAAKSLLSQSLVHDFAGQSEQAIAVLLEALPLIEATQDEHMLATAWHNLITCYTSEGRFIEAQGLYRKARPLYRKYETTWLGDRRLWVKGRIERGLGQGASAEALFLAARERFLKKQIPYEAALVSMELAMLYTEQRRTVELRQLAIEMLPIFTSLGIHREALAALSFLRHAVDTEQVSAEVVAKIASFMRRAQGDPTLKFEAPA
jgi:tetratricopeptide (TPR) repeat protein